MNQTIQTFHKEMTEAQAQINQLTLKNQLLKMQANFRELKINNPEEYKDNRYYMEIFLL